MPPAEIWLYITLLCFTIGHLLAQLYFVISYSDLEADYINPIELCDTMDVALPIEAGAHAIETLVLLLFGKWLSVLVMSPVLLFNAYMYKQTGLRSDATTIFKTVRDYRVQSMAKLVYYFLVFCYFLYCMIWSLVKYSDANESF